MRKNLARVKGRDLDDALFYRGSQKSLYINILKDTKKLWEIALWYW